MSRHDLSGRLLAGITSDGACWLWQGATTNGYGVMSWQGRQWYTHRLAYQVWVDEIPAGTVVHHTCGLKLCINPGHLQAVTPQENNAEMLHRQSFLQRIAELEEQLAVCECRAGNE